MGWTERGLHSHTFHPSAAACCLSHLPPQDFSLSLSPLPATLIGRRRGCDFCWDNPIVFLSSSSSAADLTVAMDPEQPATVEFAVLFPNGTRHSLAVPAGETIASVKQRVLNLLPGPAHPSQSVLLIFHGRMLPDSGTVASAGIADSSVVHAVISSRARRTAEDQQQQRGPQSAAASEPRGFDRLLEMGVGSDEVMFLRRTFHIQNRTPASLFMPGNEAALRRIEDEWMDRDVDPAVAAVHQSTAQQQQQQTMAHVLSPEGDNHDLLWGMVAGFFLSVLCLVMFWEKSVPRRAKWGIIAGIGFNFSFSILRLMMAS